MPTIVDNAYADYDATTNSNMATRNDMIAILKEVLPKLDIQPGLDKSTVTESKLLVITTLENILKGQESASMNRVKLALSRIDTTANKNIAAVAVEMLKHITNQPITKNSTTPEGFIDDDSLLTAKAEDKGITIKSEELSNDKSKDPSRLEVIDDKEFTIEEE